MFARWACLLTALTAKTFFMNYFVLTSEVAERGTLEGSIKAKTILQLIYQLYLNSFVYYHYVLITELIDDLSKSRKVF